MNEGGNKPAKRRLAAILACDICGYGQIMGRSEAAALKLVEQLTLLAETAVKRFEGRLLKRLGDGVILEFPSAVTAVECAALMQQRITAFNTQAPADQRFQVRIGIHLGEVVETATDTLGDGINIACRLQMLAKIGGVVLSEDIERQIHNHHHLPTAPMGTRSLKHVERPVKVFELLGKPDNPLQMLLRRWMRPRRLVIAGLILLVLIGIGKESGRKAALKQMLETLDQARILYEQGQAAESFALLEETARNNEPDSPGWPQLQAALEQVRLFRALEQAKLWSDTGRGPEAVKMLEELLTSLKPDHPLRTEISNAIRNGQNHLDQADLKQRFETFIQAWLEHDTAKISSVLDPTLRGKGELLSGMLKRRMDRSAGSRLGQKPEESRILSIDLADDRKTARIEGEIFVSNSWQRLPGTVWKKIENTWYLSVQPGWLND